MHSTQMRGDSYGRRLLFACRCGLVLGPPNKQTNKRTEKTKLNTFRNINNIIALFIVDHWSLVVCISLGEMRAFALDILVMLLCMLVVDALCVCVCLRSQPVNCVFCCDGQLISFPTKMSQTEETFITRAQCMRNRDSVVGLRSMVSGAVNGWRSMDGNMS